MSSLIVASDLDLMMLEISIEELMVPRVTEFDSALLKKTVVMFRLLDKDWSSVYPQRKDYHVYRGTNSEIEPFNGGVSVVFPIPQSSLDGEMEKVDLQLHVHRELSKYFELDQSSESVGFACIDVSDLFNGVIETLKKRMDDSTREPVANSSKNTYELYKEDGTESGAKATVYLRLTHLGHSVISEIDVPDDPKRLFYAREETSENLPYQLREITLDELTSGCWGSETLVPPKNPRDTICRCDFKGSSGKSSDYSNLTDSLGTRDSAKSVTQENEEGDKEGKKISKSEKKGKKGVGKNKNGTGKEKNGTGKKKNGNGKQKKGVDEDGNEEKNENDTEGETSGEEGAISCLVKPALCGREGTCNKKDKKGKFGKCGKPDGEGGNPLACGERRKCARRKMAAGSATVGIVDKKIPCPPPRISNVCPSPPERTCPPSSWPSCTLPAPCSRCHPVYYQSSSTPRTQNSCHSYDTTSSRYIYEPDNTGCKPMHVGWR